MTSVEIDHVHFESDLVGIGTFHCPPTYPEFGTAGQINHYLLAFPRTSVYIQYASAPPVVADPTVVMLYNPGQPYRRKILSPHGDISDWFTFSAEVVRDALRPLDPAAAESENLFVFSHSPSAPDLYLQQRIVLRHATGEAKDQLFIEETLQGVLARVLAQAYQAAYPVKLPTAGRATRARTRRAHRELIHEARALLARRYTDGLTLDDLAAALHTSPYHLARLFRRYTGQTLHNYRNQIRLHASLERVAGSSDLAGVAVGLGYASHSHFSSAFRRAYGLTPSSFRKLDVSRPAQARALRKTSKIFTV